MLRLRLKLQSQITTLGRRDNLLSKRFTPVSLKVLEIVLDVGSAVPNTTSSMSDYMAAKVKEFREATILMNDNLRVEEPKRKQRSAAQKEPHDIKLQRTKDSYSYCA